jgi:hypothetical protein
MLALLTIVGGASLTPASSLAATQDYSFKLTDPVVHAGEKAPVSVRLIQTSTGKAVTGTTITDQKLNMLMGIMMPMPSSVKASGSDSNGNYLFACNVMVPGDRTLDLSAQVPGEQSPPVHSTIKFHVTR